MPPTFGITKCEKCGSSWNTQVSDCRKKCSYVLPERILFAERRDEEETSFKFLVLQEEIGIADPHFNYGK